jgi:hypothetical protein
MWQDFYISIGTFIFAVLLIPQLRSSWRGYPASLTTSLGTAMILYTFAYTFFTLELFFTSMVNIVTASAWFLIFYFSWKRAK